MNVTNDKINFQMDDKKRWLSPEVLNEEISTMSSDM